MKRSLLLVFTLAGSLVVTAQKPQWDSAYRPSTYIVKTELFRAFPNSTNDIIFLGNSITDYTEWNELLGLSTARNRGISGDITFGVLQRLDEVTEGKPAKVFILIGINDISRNIPDTVIVANYKKIISRIKRESPQTKIYFNTLLPVNNTFPNRDNFTNKFQNILNVNEEIRKLATTEGITVIDIHPHFLDAENKLDKKYTYDGLHLDGDGYQKWASLLKPYLN